MDLFLFTNFFPFKRSEPFLVNEFEFTRQYAATINILSLYGYPADNILNNAQLKVQDPVFEKAGSFFSILLKGLFNLSPCGYHLSYIFKREIFFNKKNLYRAIVSLLVTRAALASPGMKRMLESIKTSDDPVLYFYWGDNLVWTLPYIRKKSGNTKFRSVLRLHGSDLYEHLSAGRSPIRNEVFKIADQICTVSVFGENYLRARYPLYAPKIKTSRLGVYDNGISTPPQKRILVSVSNAVPLKRIHLLVEALKTSVYHLEWHHFGDGVLLQSLKEQAAQVPAHIHIKFHGHVQNAQLIEFYRSKGATVFINMSSSEGLPVSVMEALSFGIPVLATDAGGTRELVNDEVGKLLPLDLTAGILNDAMSDFFQLSEKEQMGLRQAARNRFLEMVDAEKNYRAFYEGLL